MPFGWVAAATIGSALLGANASKNAADTQAQSARDASGVQKAMYDQTSANVAPYLDAGKASLADLTKGVAGGAFTPTSYAPGQQLSAYAPAGMQQTIGAGPQLAGYGSVGQMDKVAAAQQQKAYQDYTAQNPYVSKGDWTADKFQQDPGYQFQLAQGQNALTNAASLSGGMNSNNLKGLLGYSQGLANQDYQQAFNNYQTEAGRSLNEYQTGLQDYMQQFNMGQNVNTLNNNVMQSNFNNSITGTGFNNNVTQTQYDDMMRTTAANNANAQQMFGNTATQAGFNNNSRQQDFTNMNATMSNNNNVITANNNLATQNTQLNNQNKQQDFSNLSALAGMGLGAGLQQGQISSQVGQNIGNNIIGAGNAQAAGTIGSANAIAGGIGQGYNAYLQNQYMNKAGQYGYTQQINNALSGDPTSTIENIGT